MALRFGVTPEFAVVQVGAVGDSPTLPNANEFIQRIQSTQPIGCVRGGARCPVQAIGTLVFGAVRPHAQIRTGCGIGVVGRVENRAIGQAFDLPCAEISAAFPQGTR
jgi:hypothetical protein